MNSNKKIVTLRQSGGYTMLPPELHSDVVLRIGSKIDRGTKSVLIGLSEDEREVILPKIIRSNSSNKDLDWFEKVERFYAELTILIPFEGLELNIATRKQEVTVNGKKQEVDYPVAPMDYIMYKQALVDPSVATTEVEIREKSLFKAVLVNKHVEKQKQIELQNTLDKIDGMYLNVVSKNTEGKFKNMPRLDSVVRLLGENPQFMDDAEKVFALSRYKEKAKDSIKSGVGIEDTPFYSVINDDKLGIKSTIMVYVEKNIISQEGTNYRYTSSDGKHDVVLGNTMDQAVAFFENAVNSAVVTSMNFKNSGKIDKLEKLKKVTA